MNNRPIDEWTPGFRASDMPVVEGGEPNPLEDAPANLPPGTDGCDPKPTNNLPPPPGAPMVEHALDYARRGWPVFPCKPTNKAPFFKGGFHAATTDEAKIRSWWGYWPKADDRRADGIALRRLGSRSRSAKEAGGAGRSRGSGRMPHPESMASYRPRTPRLRRAAGNISCLNGTRPGR